MANNLNSTPFPSSPKPKIRKSLIVILSLIAIAVIVSIIANWDAYNTVPDYQFEDNTENRVKNNRPSSSPNTVNQQQDNSMSFNNLPNGVFSEQIANTYSINSSQYALALEPNANFYLPALDGETITWHGVLKSQDNGKTWIKFFSVSNPIDPTQNGQKIKYNPVGIFQDNSKIYVDIANDRGAGSGEGQLIRFTTSDNGTIWQQTGCYYFVPENYYAKDNSSIGYDTSSIEPHTLKPIQGCIY